MADDGTDLFVRTDSGSVAVIDPDKSAEARRLPLGAGGLCQGIGAGGGVIWSCDPNPSGTADDVLRVNPKSGKVERFAVGKRADQGHLDVAASRVWVITDAGLVGLDLTNGKPDPPIDPGVPGSDLTATEGRAYVVSFSPGEPIRVGCNRRNPPSRVSPAILPLPRFDWCVTRPTTGRRPVHPVGVVGARAPRWRPDRGVRAPRRADRSDGLCSSAMPPPTRRPSAP
jgi:hypothetical protein